LIFLIVEQALRNGIKQTQYWATAACCFRRGGSDVGHGFCRRCWTNHITFISERLAFTILQKRY